MRFEDKLWAVRETLAKEGLDGWLLFDCHGINSLGSGFLEIPRGKMATRRLFYWIPYKGSPVKIVSRVEPDILDHLPGTKLLYRGWEEFERLLSGVVTGKAKIAMEYSPENALPTVSRVDAGTIELVRMSGVEVVSSANLLQYYTSVWSKEQLESHLVAASVLEEIVDRTWEWIAHSLRLSIPINEYQVHQFMLQAVYEAGCETDAGPICAVNVHSADPHYHPDPNHALVIQAGDVILLDLWCKQQALHSVYADITRVGVAADRPMRTQRQVFDILKQARDYATLLIKEHHEQRRPLQGWKVDQVCRDIIEAAGYGEYFVHRTGHNIGEEVHGAGANLDNLETHDHRELLPGTCVSVEPGIYLPGQFGMRLEYDVFLDPDGEARITGGIQEHLVCLSR